ncbi:major facilitator superfamily domain-containing protein [Fennellomyces sp. T-0311]|nr:major facilitator superfamily domain-containing protein [Fennellomyces sp. T-0311]
MDFENSIAGDQLSTVSSTEVGTPDAPEHGSLFSYRQRMLILACICLTNVGAPLTVQIYYPALPAIQMDLHTSVTAVNASVSVYKLMQAICPPFLASISDMWGRRPLYMFAAPIAGISCIGLALSPTIGWLIGLRVLQAIGTSPLFVLGYGVISDIAKVSSRPLYLSVFFTTFRTFTLAGPVVGGTIVHHLSWRYIFWLLLAITSVSFSIVILFLPETLPSLVGTDCNLTPIQWIRRKRARPSSDSIWHESINTGNDVKCCTPTNLVDTKQELYQSKKSIRDFTITFQNLTKKHIATTILIQGLYNGAQDCYNITTAYLFKTYFHLDEQAIGLCYLAQSIGGVVGGLSAGVYLTFWFKKAVRRYTGKTGRDITNISNLCVVPYDFPICRVRLKPVLINAFIIQVVTALYGWCYTWSVPLPVMLCLQFLVGLNFPMVDSAVSTLAMDYQPGQGASMGATSSLVTYSFGAGSSFAIYPLIETVGVGWAFTIISSILVVSNILVAILIQHGAKWRESSDNTDV